MEWNYSLEESLSMQNQKINNKNTHPSLWFRLQDSNHGPSQVEGGMVGSVEWMTVHKSKYLRDTIYKRP
ncbi:hypothetical protein TSUD_358180 [Trifolium subterraneum]|uniref:Uncharacterized protein n=1 Tax=Trifolium subterraneum TaxID=3900 RepID=A0A2Z6MNB4_TRISU|nr:hypothetical protein TSUD_358180 [Trifolium subterraneum]